MDAKTYLEQVKVLDIKIKQLEDRLACLRETAGGAAAIRDDNLTVQVSVQNDIVEKNVLQLVEMQEKIFLEKVRLESTKNAIVEQIQALNDARYVDLLYKRYINLESFEQISVDMSYDYTYTRALHGEAIGYFETYYSNILHNLT